MTRPTTLLLAILLLSLFALSLSIVDSMAAHRRISQLEAGEQKAAASDPLAAMSVEMAKSIQGMHAQVAKANAGNLRAKVIVGQRGKDNAGGQREAAANRVMVSAWYANDVVERLKKNGLKVETGEVQTGFQSPSLLCKLDDGDSFLVIRIDPAQPQGRNDALATCKSAGLKPVAWASFILGYNDEAQRDRVLAALPKVE